MSLQCNRCGRELADENISFCPYCGTRIRKAEGEDPAPDPCAVEWVRKALKQTALPKRKQILEQAIAECPGSPEIEWELLFVGHPDPRPKRGRLDYSIIKSSLLNLYRNPDEFTPEEQDRMRTELFHDPLLERFLSDSRDPRDTLRRYLDRLCREYTEVFLAGDNRLNGTVFGFALSRNKGKNIAGTVSEMIRRVMSDERLALEQRETLRDSMVQAYLGMEDGKPEYLCL